MGCTGSDMIPVQKTKHERQKMHEVQISIRGEGERNRDKCEVRQMLALSYSQTFMLGITMPPGRTVQLVQFILDTHPRRRTPNGRIRGLQSTDAAEILRRITEIGSPEREPVSDPLLWLLRVRWAIREATLALSNIQPGQKLYLPGGVPSRLSTTAKVYIAMAVWAYRCRGIQPSDDQLRMRLHYRLRRHEYGKAKEGSHNTTSHWLLWREVARGKTREEAFSDLCTAGIL